MTTHVIYPGTFDPVTNGHLDIVVSVYQQHVEVQQGKPVKDLPWGTRAKGDDLMKDITLDMVKQTLDKAINSIKTPSKDS